MSPRQFLIAFGLVLLAVAVVQTRGLIRTLRRAEPRRSLPAGVRPFTCGFRGRLPSPFSASYRLAKFYVTGDFLLIRVPVVGDFALERERILSLATDGGGLVFTKLKIKAVGESATVFVSARDWPVLRRELERRSWTVA